MNKVWVLVCDAARARLYEIRNEDPTWHAAGHFEHESSRSKSSDLAGDHLGERASEGPTLHHAALAPASSPKEVQKLQFSHTLATMLDQAMRSKRFDRWVLVAPPRFLGMVKDELTPELQKHLLAAIDNDMSSLDVGELSERLKQQVRIPAEEREVVRQSDVHPH